MKIIFVCTGNTCRSPMATALFRQAVNEAGRTDIEVSGAGLAAFEGQAAADAAIRIMREDYGLDLTDHRAKNLTVDMCSEADYIFTMTESQADALRRYLPIKVKAEITSLGKFCQGKGCDIADPYGGDDKVYRAVAGELKQLVTVALTKI